MMCDLHERMADRNNLATIAMMNNRIYRAFTVYTQTWQKGRYLMGGRLKLV